MVIAKKLRKKNQKYSFTFGKKKVVPKDYKVIRLYEKYEILKKSIIH
jgi:hypothetical protein